jgi:class 3 adenylate cyclase
MNRPACVLALALPLLAAEAIAGRRVSAPSGGGEASGVALALPGAPGAKSGLVAPRVSAPSLSGFELPVPELPTDARLRTSVSPLAIERPRRASGTGADVRPARRGDSGRDAQRSLFALEEGLFPPNEADGGRGPGGVRAALAKAFDGWRSARGGEPSIPLEAAGWRARRGELELPSEREAGEGLDEIPSVGFLTVDLKDSTKLFREEGVKRGYALAQSYLEFAEQISRKHRGAVVRHMGDGFLFLFPGASFALDAAIEIQSRIASLRRAVPGRDLRFHAAVHGGRVIVHRRAEGLDAYGQAIEEAGKILSESDGDDVAVSEGVERYLDLGGMSVRRGEGVFMLRPAPVPESAFEDELPGAQRELTRQTIETRATMFAALEDWAGTYEGFGRRKSYASIRAYQDYLRRIVERHGGMLVKTEGEGAMMSFATAADAVRAAAAIQREISMLRRAAPLGKRIRIKIGISYGRTVREDFLGGSDFFGNTVNAAARLMHRARGGEIVVSRRAVLDPVAAKMLDEAGAEESSVPAKGFDMPIRIYRVSPESIETETVDPTLGDRLARGVRRTMDRIKKIRDRTKP